MKTLRVLNERSGFLGLSVLDLGGIGYFLILTHALLGFLSLELLSFALAALLTGALIQIRLTQRPKFIRDLIKYFFTPAKLR